MRFNKITTLFRRGLKCAELLAKKHGPKVAVVVGVIGLVDGGIEVAKAIPQVKETLANFKSQRSYIEENMDDEEKRDAVVDIYKETGVELVKATFKPVVICTASAALVFIPMGIMNKEITTLAAALSTSEGILKDYRGRVRNKLGEEEEFKLFNGIEDVETVEQMTDSKGKERDVKSKKAVGPENFGKNVFVRYFNDSSEYKTYADEFNIYKINALQEYSNHKLRAQGFLLLNDVLEPLGFEKCAEGCIYGWLYDPDNPELHNLVDFGTTLIDRRAGDSLEPAIMLHFNVDGIVYDKLPKFAAA